MRCYRQARIVVMMLFAALAMPLGLAAQDDVAQAKKAQHHHYRFFDIGTFGGPNSYVGALGGVSQVLSDEGTVAGCADMSTLDLDYPNSPINPPGPDPSIFHAFQWRKGTLTDLGALPGVNSSCPLGISGSGLIVGLSENGDIDPFTGLPEARAVLWKGGQVIDLGTLGGNWSFVVSAGNSRGQVAGSATNAISDPFSGFGTQQRAFLWQSGVMQDLGTLGGPDAFAADINERGQVVGCAFTNSTPPNPNQDAFLWDNGKMTDLGNFGGTYSCAFVVNNRGQVMGSSNLPGDQVMHAFFWERGKLTDLGNLGGDIVEPFWLNDIGEVVGTAEYPGDTIRHGFLWRKGVMTDLGTLYPACSSTDTGSVATQVNSKTQIVGNSWCDGTAAAAFLWEHGGPMVDLNTLAAPTSGMQLLGAQNINERGEITGSGILANGDVHAFLLIPCDDDHPGVEGCDYSMVDGSTATTAVISAPATNVTSPITQSNPAFGGAMNPMLRRFGPRLGPWSRGMGAERPAMKPPRPAPEGITTKTTAEVAPEQSASPGTFPSANLGLQVDDLISAGERAEISAGLGLPSYAAANINSCPTPSCSSPIRGQICGIVFCYKGLPTPIYSGYDLKYKRACRYFVGCIRSTSSD